MPKSEITWVTVGPDPYLATCQRCGVRVDKPEFPMALSRFCAELNVVCEQHRECDGDGTLFWRRDENNNIIALVSPAGDIFCAAYDARTEACYLDIDDESAELILTAFSKVNLTQS